MSSMRPDDFFESTPGPWGGPEFQVNRTLLETLRSSPVDGLQDVDAAAALALMVHQELESYGTGGSPSLEDVDMRLALRTLHRVLERLDVDSSAISFRDLTTFKSYWKQKGATNNYQARRDLLGSIFEPIHDELARIEERALDATLADPITEHAGTGWPRVDVEIRELRRHFKAARTAQDYRNVGNDAVKVLEALSATVYHPDVHLRSGETEPPLDKTNMRIERFVEDSAPGPDQKSIRKLTRAASDLAHSIKHQTTPSRRDAGIIADAVIVLANMLRRLAEER